MRHWFFTGSFELFDFVVEEEVDQDSVDMRIGVISSNLSADELNAPYTAGYRGLGQHA